MKKILIISVFFLFQGICFAQWNTDRILTIGQNALYFEDYVLSIQYFNRVISVKPHLAEPYMYRAMAKINLGDYKGAEEDCNLALERNPYIPQAYYARGFARRKLGLYQEAIDDFTKTYYYSPNSWFILLNRMDARENVNDYEGAMEDLTEYMKLNPKMKALYYEKGRLHLALKDTVAAEATFDQFVQEDPKNSLAWSARGLMYLQKKDLDNALADYNKAIGLNSTFSGDYINRGIIHVQKNNFRQALSDYDKAIELDDYNTLAYYNRGLLRAGLGDYNNALDDINVVLSSDSAHMEARLKKADLESELGNYNESTKDYKLIIDNYPDFTPAYIRIAQNYKEQGNRKEFLRYHQMAADIEKGYKDEKKAETLIVAENKIDDNGQKSAAKKRNDIFNRFAAQNMDKAEKESKYGNSTRGTIQDQYTDLVTEENFVLTYYVKADKIRHVNNYHQIIDIYNKEHKQNSPVKITNNEIPLAEEQISLHFDAINNVSQNISEGTTDADVYFLRAMEFSLVQDFSNAIKDLDRAIYFRPDFALAYFCRANVRHKQIEYVNNMNDDSVFRNNEDKNSAEKQYVFESEMIIRDLDKVISFIPDFQFAYFNKANIQTSLKDYRSAVSNCSKAIEIDPAFAEAYYNRGLVYLFINEDAKGLADLSKAGELGMYKVYNLIQRFNK